MATSESAVPVQIAHSGLAEEVVVLEWLVDDGQRVEAGSPIVVIESEKTQLEIEAPASGRLEILVPASDIEVPVGTTIARVHQLRSPATTPAARAVAGRSSAGASSLAPVTW